MQSERAQHLPCPLPCAPGWGRGPQLHLERIRLGGPAWGAGKKLEGGQRR